MAKTYEVIAEMIDIETGSRILPAQPGEDAVFFAPHNDEQAERLTAAGCLRVAAFKDAPSVAPTPTPTPAAAKPVAPGTAMPVAKGTAKPAGKA